MLRHRKDLESSLKTTASFAVAHAAEVLASRWWLVEVLWVCIQRYARHTVTEAIRVERKDNAIYFSLYSSSFRFLSLPLQASCVPVDAYIAEHFFLHFLSFFLLSLPLHLFFLFLPINPHLDCPLLASSAIKGPLLVIIIVVDLNAPTLHRPAASLR